jgi:ABC-2 type transport system ATP-binding protein
MSSIEPIIVFKDFTKEFYDKLILHKINLNINEGEILGIVGMSGSGKTTLLNSIIGFLQPDEGSVLYKYGNEYKSIHKNPSILNTLFGFASQQPSFYSKLTVEENLDHFGALYNLTKIERKSSVENLLNLTSLFSSKNSLAKNLSGGMQKRLSIACALIHSPKVLILDEPTSDLDPFLRKQTWGLIKDINSRGTTVIIASHFLDEIEHNCSRVAILHNSQIVSCGTPQELREKFSGNYEIHVETEQLNYHQILSNLDSSKSLVLSSNITQDKLILQTQNPATTMHHLLHLIPATKQTITNIQITKPKLDEVFESLTQNAKDS